MHKWVHEGASVRVQMKLQKIKLQRLDQTKKLCTNLAPMVKSAPLCPQDEPLYHSSL